jgi:hypothetical protein
MGILSRTYGPRFALPFLAFYFFLCLVSYLDASEERLLDSGYIPNWDPTQPCVAQIQGFPQTRACGAV